MAEVTLHTLALKSSGVFKCRFCNRQTMIDEGEFFLIWDSGRGMLVEYATGSLLHRCGRELETYCPTCGPLSNIVIPSRGSRLVPRCLACGGEAKQRAVPPSRDSTIPFGN